jgi:transcriptional regulator with XRE-family HTH domain
MADYRERLAKKLEHERERKSYSQDTLALRSGVSSKTIKRIEEQKVDSPRPVTIRRLADALDIDPAELRPPNELEGDQLERIEAKVDALLDYFEIDFSATTAPERAVAAARRARAQSQRKQPARDRKRASG